MYINFVLKPYYRTEECIDKIRACLDSGWLGPGDTTSRLESNWATETGLQNNLFLNSNTSGLHLALEALKRKAAWPYGSEVITTPITFIATNHAIRYASLIPVFADVDDSLCLDPNVVESRITKKTEAVIYVGIGGNAANYNEIKEICVRHGLALIVDAAHMAGTRDHRNQHIGRHADATVFSFQAVKNLPTADSGLVSFKNADAEDIARRLSWMGIDKSTAARTSNSGGYQWDYSVDDLGFKYNGNAIMASIAEVGLKYLEEDNSYRRDLASVYDRLLSELPDIKLVRQSTNYVSSRHLYQIVVPDRPSLANHLKLNGIGYGVHYRDNTLYRMYKDADGLNATARRLSESIVSLPLHLHLEKTDVEDVCEVIKRWVDR